MFRYVSLADGKEKTIDLNTQACLQARFIEKMSWNNIANTGEHQDQQERAVRFGAACNTRNLNDARQSEEWEKEVHRFADEGGHDAHAVLNVAVPRQRANPAPPPSPKLEDVDTEPLTTAKVVEVPLSDKIVEVLGNLRAADSVKSTTLEAVSTPSQWVRDTEGNAINLEHAHMVSMGHPDTYEDPQGVFAMIDDVQYWLYVGKYAQEYHTWVTTEVLGISDFEWGADEDEEEGNIIADEDAGTHHHWIVADENPEAEADEEYEWDEDEDAD